MVIIAVGSTNSRHRTEIRAKFLSEYLKRRYVARKNQAYVMVDIIMNLNEMDKDLNPTGLGQSRVAGM
jgi:hypothetical protein